MQGVRDGFDPRQLKGTALHRLNRSCVWKTSATLLPSRSLVRGDGSEPKTDGSCEEVMMQADLGDWEGRLVVTESGAVFDPRCPGCARFYKLSTFSARQYFDDRVEAKIVCARCGEVRAAQMGWREDFYHE